jgi:hypothetical protein
MEFDRGMHDKMKNEGETNKERGAMCVVVNDMNPSVKPFAEAERESILERGATCTSRDMSVHGDTHSNKLPVGIVD